MATLAELITLAGKVAVLKAHPVGSYFMTEENRNPAEILGLGGAITWVRLTDRVLVGAGGSYAVGSEGGEATHTLTEAEMPKHKHMGIFGVSGSQELKFQNNPTGNELGSATINNTYNSSANYTSSAYTGQTGSGTAHNNLQPYRACFIWRRTA